MQILKEKRQQTILDLIRAENITRQEELTALLTKKGFSVTQSSVSRDLDELGVVKASGFYAPPQAADTAERFGLLALEMAGENLIVARCEAGLASAVAVKIDRARIAEIVGTIAGDDTIFVAIKNHKAQKTAMRKIWETFEK